MTRFALFPLAARKIANPAHNLSVMPPLAHVGHWLWALYLPPVLIVAGSIARTKLLERREARRDEASSTPGEAPDERQ